LISCEHFDYQKLRILLLLFTHPHAATATAAEEEEVVTYWLSSLTFFSRFRIICVRAFYFVRRKLFSKHGRAGDGNFLIGDRMLEP
jgi:hypothetical protein